MSGVQRPESWYTHAVMKLVFPDPPTGVDPGRIEVMLFGRDTETGDDVECRVTAKALMKSCGARGQTDEELLRAFDEYRPKIEEAAQRKHEAGKIKQEFDRIVIRLDQEDL